VTRDQAHAPAVGTADNLDCVPAKRERSPAIDYDALPARRFVLHRCGDFVVCLNFRRNLSITMSAEAHSDESQARYPAAFHRDAAVELVTAAEGCSGKDAAQIVAQPDVIRVEEVVGNAGQQSHELVVAGFELGAVTTRHQDEIDLIQGCSHHIEVVPRYVKDAVVAARGPECCLERLGAFPRVLGKAEDHGADLGLLQPRQRCWHIRMQLIAAGENAVDALGARQAPWVTERVGGQSNRPPLGLEVTEQPALPD